MDCCDSTSPLLKMERSSHGVVIGSGSGGGVAVGWDDVQETRIRPKLSKETNTFFIGRHPLPLGSIMQEVQRFLQDLIGRQVIGINNQIGMVACVSEPPELLTMIFFVPVELEPRGADGK
jgi:hypothetical protein